MNANWAELVRESKGEWGLKAVLFIGVWIVAPVTGALKFEFNQVFILLVLIFTFLPFANRIMDEVIEEKRE